MKHKASQNAKFGINFVLLWPQSYLIFEHIKHSSFCVGLVDSLDMSMLDLCVNFFEQFCE